MNAVDRLFAIRQGHQGVGKEGQGCRTCPGPPDPDLFQVVAHQFAYEHAALHGRDDLEQVVGRCRQTRTHRLGIQRLVLLDHSRHGHPQPWVAQPLGGNPQISWPPAIVGKPSRDKAWI